MSSYLLPRRSVQLPRHWRAFPPSSPDSALLKTSNIFSAENSIIVLLLSLKVQDLRSSAKSVPVSQSVELKEIGGQVKNAGTLN